MDAKIEQLWSAQEKMSASSKHDASVLETMMPTADVFPPLKVVQDLDHSDLNDGPAPVTEGNCGGDPSSSHDDYQSDSKKSNT